MSVPPQYQLRGPKPRMSYGWAAHEQFWLNSLVYLLSLFVFAGIGYLILVSYKLGKTGGKSPSCLIYQILVGVTILILVSSGVQPLPKRGLFKFTFFQFLMTWYQRAGFQHQLFSAETNAITSEAHAEPHGISNAVLILCKDYLCWRPTGKRVHVENIY